VCLAAFWRGLIQKFSAGRKLDPEVGRKPDADHHQSRMNEPSRDALAGKLSIGPIQIGRESLPGQTNLPSAPF
jgi:hypothetical protein